MKLYQAPQPHKIEKKFKNRKENNQERYNIIPESFSLEEDFNKHERNKITIHKLRNKLSNQKKQINFSCVKL